MNDFYWLFGWSAAFLIGMAKSGIKGLGPFYVLLMSQVFGSKASTGIIVPLFVIGDIFAVITMSLLVRQHGCILSLIF